MTKTSENMLTVVKQAITGRDYETVEAHIRALLDTRASGNPRLSRQADEVLVATKRALAEQKVLPTVPVEVRNRARELLTTYSARI